MMRHPLTVGRLRRLAAALDWASLPMLAAQSVAAGPGFGVVGMREAGAHTWSHRERFLCCWPWRSASAMLALTCVNASMLACARLALLTTLPLLSLPCRRGRPVLCGADVCQPRPGLRAPGAALGILLPALSGPA